MALFNRIIFDQRAWIKFRFANHMHLLLYSKLASLNAIRFQIFSNIYYLYESNYRGKSHGRSTSSKRPG